MAEYRTLKDFILLYLRQAEIVPLPEKEEWGDMIPRTAVTGRIAEVDEETFDWFLECLPPKYQDAGFAFAEGAEPLKYFWTQKADGKVHYFVRQLTDEETATFCRLARIPLPH